MPPQTAQVPGSPGATGSPGAMPLLAASCTTWGVFLRPAGALTSRCDKVGYPRLPGSPQEVAWHRPFLVVQRQEHTRKNTKRTKVSEDVSFAAVLQCGHTKVDQQFRFDVCQFPVSKQLRCVDRNSPGPSSRSTPDGTPDHATRQVFEFHASCSSCPSW